MDQSPYPPFAYIRTPKSADYTATGSDNGQLLDFTSAATLSLTAAATLGNSWRLWVYNSSSGVLTINPNGAEVIRTVGGTTPLMTLAQGETALIVCTGTAFEAIAQVHVAPSVRDFGATGDGVTDDATAFQAAITARANKSLYIPPGTYIIGTGLVNTSTAIYGDDGNFNGGTAATVLRPTNAVAVAMTMNGGQLHHLTIDGQDTSGKIGLLLGSVLSANFIVNNVAIQTFAGAGAIGLKLRQCVSVTLQNLYIVSNALNAYITDAAGDSTPTTIWFKDCYFRASTIDEGVLQDGGYQICYQNCVFENNKKEGLKVYPSTGNSLHGVLTNCWFEDNWHGAASPTTHQHCVVDGTATSGSAGLHFNGVVFVGSGSTCKAISLNKVFYTTICNVVVPTGSTQILITNAAGEVEFIGNGGRIDFATNVDNSGGGYVNYGGTFQDDYFKVLGTSDTTKVFRFEVDGFTTATTRTWTVPNRSDTLAGLGAQTFTGAQTINNKVLMGAASLAADFTGMFGTPYSAIIGGNNTAYSQVALSNYNGTAGASYIGAHTRSTGTDADVIVANGDQLAYFGAFGADGAAYQEGGNITFEVDAPPGASDMPTRTVFRVTPDGSATPAEYMRANNLGALLIKKMQGWGVSSTATAGGTTTLDGTSRMIQTFTGILTETIVFPAANLLGAGVAVMFIINNQSTGTVTPTRAGSDTFQGGGTTDAVLTGTTTRYASDGVSVWLKW